jgi:hypothetical protein
MSYKNLINTNLTKAFNLIKDLAEDVIFVKRNSTVFDFNAADLKTSTTTQVVLKAIVINSKKNSKTDSGHNTSKKQIMLKSKDVGDISLYDSLILNNETWKFGPVLQNTGFVILAEISKEV